MNRFRKFVAVWNWCLQSPACQASALACAFGVVVGILVGILVAEDGVRKNSRLVPQDSEEVLAGEGPRLPSQPLKLTEAKVANVEEIYAKYMGVKADRSLSVVFQCPEAAQEPRMELVVEFEEPLPNAPDWKNARVKSGTLWMTSRRSLYPHASHDAFPIPGSAKPKPKPKIDAEKHTEKKGVSTGEIGFGVFLALSLLLFLFAVIYHSSPAGRAKERENHRKSIERSQQHLQKLNEEDAQDKGP